MAYSSGAFSLVSGNPVVTGTTVSSTWANNTLNDIASGLSTCVLKDGTQTVTANLPMSSFKLTGLAAGAANGESIRFEQMASFGVLPVSSIAGTANAITGATSPVPTLAANMQFTLIPTASNTGATTLALNSGAAKNIFLNGAALAGYELRKNCPVTLLYDGTQYNIISGAHGGDGIAIGSIRAQSSSSAPNAHLLCYGQAISRTTYADLFAVISTTYGTGDGSTTFNLPDLRGRAVFGVDNMGGVAASRVTNGNSGITGTTLGAAGGSELLHQHTHTATSVVTDNGHTHTANTYSGASYAAHFGGLATVTADNSATTNSATTGVTVATTNANAGTGSSQNMPPAMMMNYVIKF